MVKVIFHYQGTALKGKNSLPLGEVHILKRDAIEENHCLI